MEKQTFKIEMNPHFKPDECVLVCGSEVYASLPIDEQGGNHAIHRVAYTSWTIRVRRKAHISWEYVKVNQGVATVSKKKSTLTPFGDYREARMIAEKLLESHLFDVVTITEALSLTKEVY